jgi:hypothetical protein
MQNGFLAVKSEMKFVFTHTNFVLFIKYAQFICGIGTWELELG